MNMAAAFAAPGATKLQGFGEDIKDIDELDNSSEKKPH